MFRKTGRVGKMYLIVALAPYAIIVLGVIVCCWIGFTMVRKTILLVTDKVLARLEPVLHAAKEWFDRGHKK